MALRDFKKARGGFAAPRAATPSSPAARSLLPSFRASFSTLLGGGHRHKDRILNLSRTQPVSTGHPEPQRRGNFSEAREVLAHSLLDDSDDDDSDVQEDGDDVLAVPLEDSSSEESMDEQEDGLFRPWMSSASPGWTLPDYHGVGLYEEEVPSLNLQKKQYPVCRDDFSTDDDEDEDLEEDSAEEDSPEEEDLFSWATEEQANEDVVGFAVPAELNDLLCSESDDLEEDDEVAAPSPDIFTPLPDTLEDLLFSESEDLEEDEEVAAIFTHLPDTPDNRRHNILLQQTPDSGRTEPLPTADSPTPLVSPSHPGGASVPESPSSSTLPSCDSTTPGGSTAHAFPNVPATSVFRPQRAPKRILPTLTPFQQTLMDMSFRQNIYVGRRRHHAMARGMDLPADVIKEYFKRWRMNGFRKLHRIGLSDHVTKIRNLHRSTLPFYQEGSPPSSTSSAPSLQPLVVHPDQTVPQPPQVQLPVLPGPQPQVHQVQPVHQVSMSQLQLSQLRDNVQALVLQPLASQTQVLDMSSSSGRWDVHQAPAGRERLAPYQFNRPWVFQPNDTQ